MYRKNYAPGEQPTCSRHGIWFANSKSVTRLQSRCGMCVAQQTLHELESFMPVIHDKLLCHNSGSIMIVAAFIETI